MIREISFRNNSADIAGNTAKVKLCSTPDSGGKRFKLFRLNTDR